MGTSSSREANTEAAEVKSLESRLASLGDLPTLRTLFSHLSTSSGLLAPHLLKEYFELHIQGSRYPASSQLSVLSENVASTIIDIIFEPNEKGISWSAFLKGMERCHQQSVSLKLKLLLFFFYRLEKKSELPITFSFTNEDIGDLLQADVTGDMSLSELRDFLWLCWLMGCDANSHDKDSLLDLPNVEPLVKSANLACLNKDQAAESYSMEKLHKWMLRTTPGLPISLLEYIQVRLHKSAASIQQKEVLNNSNGPNDSLSETAQASGISLEGHLFSSSVAWAIGLFLPGAIGENILSCSFSAQQDTAALLYRSSLHGKGMNRFWVHVEGYQGTVLMLIQGSTLHGMEDKMTQDSGEENWLVGAFLNEGFSNKSCYYGGRECCIFALDPVMQPFRSTGVGSNFIYSHSHGATSTAYLQQQKGPEGIAFGGDIGKERLFLDGDFMHLIIHHHAVDKTYEGGHLVPNQGYGTIKGKVLDVEVWGLGGAATRQKQAEFLGRKNLFEEQKRKVDLKSFGNWSDSPEKLMMDMVGDPNRGQRQDR